MKVHNPNHRIWFIEVNAYNGDGWCLPIHNAWHLSRNKARQMIKNMKYFNRKNKIFWKFRISKFVREDFWGIM